ncbi:MAG: flagellar motor switch protein FliN [Pseudomonadota bacterium]
MTNNPSQAISDTDHSLDPQGDDFANALEEFEANVDFPAEPSTPEAGADPISMDELYDVPVTVSAVLGRRRMDVASLLDLEAGALIDLDRKVGEPVDLYINNQLIARGELVIVDGGLGISMTEIIHPNDTAIALSKMHEDES